MLTQYVARITTIWIMSKLLRLKSFQLISCPPLRLLGVQLRTSISGVIFSKAKGIRRTGYTNSPPETVNAGLGAPIISIAIIIAIAVIVLADILVAPIGGGGVVIVTVTVIVSVSTILQRIHQRACYRRRPRRRASRGPLLPLPSCRRRRRRHLPLVPAKESHLLRPADLDVPLRLVHEASGPLGRRQR